MSLKNIIVLVVLISCVSNAFAQHNSRPRGPRYNPTGGRTEPQREQETETRNTQVDPKHPHLSVEDQLVRDGAIWFQATDAWDIGSIVIDTLRGRSNRPATRGSLGVVEWIYTDGSARVNFGRGYTISLSGREIAAVRIYQSNLPQTSYEEHLLSTGNRWFITSDPIVPGAFVVDTLHGRANQPSNRGSVAYVLDVVNGRALVDFGQGYMIELSLHEVSSITFYQGNGPHLSMEEALIRRGMRLRASSSSIRPGMYVEDRLRERLNQPRDRGNIALVVSISGNQALVDFGRNYIIYISVSELIALESVY